MRCPACVPFRTTVPSTCCRAVESPKASFVNFVIATTNQGKLAEVATLLADISGIVLHSIADYPDMPEVIEDGNTFLENALIKARATCSYTGVPALADDSGLVVDALCGEPGIHSARFAPTTPERNDRLLALMADVPEDRRTARFVCALAYVRPDGFEWTVEGTVEAS